MALITIREAAMSLAISPKQVRRLIEQGEIPVIPCGKGAKGERIDPDDIETYKRRKKVLRNSQCSISGKVVPIGKSASSGSVSRELENLLGQPRDAKRKQSRLPS
jgi:excisionase family DNA binding protein